MTPSQNPGAFRILKPTAAELDAAGLADKLRSRLRGEVRSDASARALYATDASNYRQVPIGVVFPRDNDDVLAALEACRQFGAPILGRGAGTSLAGQCCNVAVVMDFSRHMDRIIEIDPDRRIARVQPGVVLDTLRNAAEKHGLTFAPDPASHDRCTLGGMIGNNSCGVHSVMAGKTDDNIETLDIVTYGGTRMRAGQTSPSELNALAARPGHEGEIYRKLQALTATYAPLVRQRFPNIPRRVSGYNLNWLLPENGFHVARALVGSEGTCVTVLEATCRLVSSPPQRVLLVVGFPDIYQCADHIPQILEHKPIGLEGFDDVLVGYTRRKQMNAEGLALLPDGGGWLLVEFGAESKAAAEAQARGLVDSLNAGPIRPNLRLVTDATHSRRLWEVRESSLGVTSHVPGEPLHWEGWEDSAVAPEKLGAYLRDLRKLMVSFGYDGSFYGHFGHACVHTRINFDLQSRAGVVRFRRFMEEAADLVIGYGGSLSGEHGDGQARAELLPKMFGPDLMRAFAEFKSAWDPDWKMNPGKVIAANKLDENLRLGSTYAPWQPQTRFAFPDDHGSLAEATLRCVGVGKCRRDEGGVMCPSFRVTRDEAHSTRGRAHLLWEMAKGEVIRDGWRSQEVKQALDLCLGCKGCKSDCPVGVDVATYKSEFLSHHYQGRIRPRSHFAFGYVDAWARLGSWLPELANWFTQTPLLRDLAKWGAGVAPARNIPPLASQSFVKLFQRRDRPGPCARPRVLLWPDTFNNYFLPATALAAVEFLEHAGFTVTLPREKLCCGRPLYDFGRLDRAEALLRRILDALAGEIAAGIPVIVLEPSCASVFRDELCNLLPNDDRAHALARQTFLLSEFLETHADEISWPRLEQKALLHGHCHHKAIMKLTAEESLLKRIGIDVTQPAPGCCGMAGAFGFERETYDVSMAIGQLELLPAVAKTPDDWLIIADGFSCREQIGQASGRRALHVAEVLRLALSAK